MNQLVLDGYIGMVHWFSPPPLKPEHPRTVKVIWVIANLNIYLGTPYSNPTLLYTYFLKKETSLKKREREKLKVFFYELHCEWVRRNFPRAFSSRLKSLAGAFTYQLRKAGSTNILLVIHPPPRVQSEGYPGESLWIIFVTSCPWIKGNTEWEIGGQEVIYYSVELFMPPCFLLSRIQCPG